MLLFTLTLARKAGSNPPLHTTQADKPLPPFFTLLLPCARTFPLSLAKRVKATTAGTLSHCYCPFSLACVFLLIPRPPPLRTHCALRDPPLPLAPLFILWKVPFFIRSGLVSFSPSLLFLGTLCFFISSEAVTKLRMLFFLPDMDPSACNGLATEF